MEQTKSKRFVQKGNSSCFNFFSSLRVNKNSMTLVNLIEWFFFLCSPDDQASCDFSFFMSLEGRQTKDNLKKNMLQITLKKGSWITMPTTKRRFPDVWNFQNSLADRTISEIDIISLCLFSLSTVLRWIFYVQQVPDIWNSKCLK